MDEINQKTGTVKGIQAIWYDFKHGILKRWYVYLIILAVFGMLTWKAVDTLELIGAEVTFMNILVLMFKGCLEFSEMNKEVKIPVEYIGIIISSALIHGWYVRDEFSKRGTLVILRMRNMSHWWRAKCVWGIFSTFVITGILIISVLIATILFGDGAFGVTEAVNMNMEMPLHSFNNSDIMLYTIGNMFITILTLTQIQIFVQMSISPVVAMIINIAVMIISAFDFAWYLLGNNIMLLRSCLTREDGLVFTDGLILCMVLNIVIYIAGKWYAHRKELL